MTGEQWAQLATGTALWVVLPVRARRGPGPPRRGQVAQRFRSTRAVAHGVRVTTARVVFPHQLFVEHLDADPGTLMVLVEPDLFFRQLPFHPHKLVLHRATMRAFAERLRDSGLRRRVRRDVGGRHQRRAAPRGARRARRRRGHGVRRGRRLARPGPAGGLPSRRGRADRAGDPGLPHLARRDRRDVRRREAAADAALLRAAAPPARPADGRRPPGRRPLVLRHREPQAAARRTCRSPTLPGPPAATTSATRSRGSERGVPRQPGRPGGATTGRPPTGRRRPG